MNNRALTFSILAAVVAIAFVETYVSSIEEETKKKLKGITGSVAIVPIKKGEQMTYTKISEPSMRTGLSTQIAPGRRAVSVPVSEITGVSKLVKPGDRIDLISVVDMGQGKENKFAKTILQDVVVLSIGRYITNNTARSVEADPLGGKDKIKSLAEDFSFTSITIEVEPAQAQMLALLLATGDNGLTVSLRNNDDVDRQTLPSVFMSEILGADAARMKTAKK
ncbi:MAG: Flp pilus assembly protein CpaB [Bdellovibrio sp.]|nr:Flp pilus assembly protein CpaB [Bdellovibrio sp.]